MKRVVFFLLVSLALMACHRAVRITGVTTEAIPVDASCDPIADNDYTNYLQPTKQALAREMDVQIGFAPDTLWVAKPECPMLNWASDALWEAAKRVCPEPVDMAVVNIGGMRCDWLPGPITVGHIYELMPFDNHLVVLTLSGADILDLCAGFAERGGEGVAGLRMTAVDGRLAQVLIGDKVIDAKRNYRVATSDYLSGGADQMDALTRYSDYWDSELLIRDVYLDIVKEQDTLRAKVDGRMNVL